MILRKKSIPLQARTALGFRGSRTERSCYKCGRTEENNFDPITGALHVLQVISIDKNLNNGLQTNHYFECRTCKKKTLS